MGNKCGVVPGAGFALIPGGPSRQRHGTARTEVLVTSGLHISSGAGIVGVMLARVV